MASAVAIAAVSALEPVRGASMQTRAIPKSNEHIPVIGLEALDFIQLPYSLADRSAEQRLLPAARDSGTAVLVMRPFAEGALFRAVKNKSLPPWAAEFDCTSWAQFFLKFILSHPAVTAPIPATSNPDHVSDNVRAASGRLPTAEQRRKMLAVL